MATYQVSKRLKEANKKIRSLISFLPEYKIKRLIEDKYSELKDELRLYDEENSLKIYSYLNDSFNAFYSSYKKGGMNSKELHIMLTKLHEEIDTYLIFIFFVRDPEKLIKIKDKYEKVFGEDIKRILRNYAKFVNLNNKLIPIKVVKQFRELFSVKWKQKSFYRPGKVESFRKLLANAAERIVEDEVTRIKAAYCLKLGSLALERDEGFKRAALFYLMGKEEAATLENRIKSLHEYLKYIVMESLVGKNDKIFIEMFDKIEKGISFTTLVRVAPVEKHIKKDKKSISIYTK